LGNLILPWHFRADPSHFYGGMNFGEIEFDWSATPPLASVRVLGGDGKIKFEHKISAVKSNAMSCTENCSKCDAMHEINPITTFLKRVLISLIVIGILLFAPINLYLLVNFICQKCGFCVTRRSTIAKKSKFKSHSD